MRHPACCALCPHAQIPAPPPDTHDFLVNTTLPKHEKEGIVVRMLWAASCALMCQHRSRDLGLKDINNETTRPRIVTSEVKGVSHAKNVRLAHLSHSGCCCIHHTVRILGLHKQPEADAQDSGHCILQGL